MPHEHACRARPPPPSKPPPSARAVRRTQRSHSQTNTLLDSRIAVLSNAETELRQPFGRPMLLTLRGQIQIRKDQIAEQRAFGGDQREQPHQPPERSPALPTGSGRAGRRLATADSDRWRRSCQPPASCYGRFALRSARRSGHSQAMIDTAQPATMARREHQACSSSPANTSARTRRARTARSESLGHLQDDVGIAVERASCRALRGPARADSLRRVASAFERTPVRRCGLPTADGGSRRPACTAKLYGGGGDGTDHSSVGASHGLSPAGRRASGSPASRSRNISTPTREHERADAT